MNRMEASKDSLFLPFFGLMVAVEFAYFSPGTRSGEGGRQWLQTSSSYFDHYEFQQQIKS